LWSKYCTGEVRSHGVSGVAGVRPSIEETALPLRALGSAPEHASARERGLAWLVERWERGEARHPAPIGLYFARLWFSETLYPLIFTMDALNHCRLPST
jgi:squalene-hopene/tetraprenyl-beta-curcumene cyclase